MINEPYKTKFESITADTWEAFSGIGLAGGLYAMLVWIAGMSMMVVSTVNTNSWPGLGAFVGWVLSVLVGLGIVCVVGLMYASTIAICVLLLTTLFNSSMNFPMSARFAGAVAAGLTAFTATGFLLIPYVVNNPPRYITGTIVAITLGPVLSMLLAQMLAEYQVEKRLRIRKQKRAVDDVAASQIAGQNQRYQFSVQTMLVLTAWAAALFAALKMVAFAVPIGTCFTIIATYLALQILCLPVGWLVRPLLAGRMERSVSIDAGPSDLETASTLNRSAH